MVGITDFLTGVNTGSRSCDISTRVKITRNSFQNTCIGSVHNEQHFGAEDHDSHFGEFDEFDQNLESASIKMFNYNSAPKRSTAYDQPTLCTLQTEMSDDLVPDTEDFGSDFFEFEDNTGDECIQTEVYLNVTRKAATVMLCKTGRTHHKDE